MKVSIGKLAKELGVSKDTLRRWEQSGKISSERNPKGHRRYDLNKIISGASKKSLFSKNHRC